MASKHRVSVNLSLGEHRELDALAKEARISKAWLGRQAITEFLERNRDGKVQFSHDLPKTRARRHPK